MTARAIVVFAVVAACSPRSPQRSLRVAAASDLAGAFAEIGAAFAAKTDITPMIDFGASGVLARQISDGTPYALFAAASSTYIDAVVAAGRCDGATVRAYARGRLVVWTAGDFPSRARFADLADARFARIAIASPEHAPYGRAAKEALERAGLWDALRDRLEVTEDVQTAMQRARERRVDAAIVSLSLAPVHDGGAMIAIDPSLYEPIEQTLVVCGAGDDAAGARQLADFIASAEGREVLDRYGFVAPHAPAAVR